MITTALQQSTTRRLHPLAGEQHIDRSAGNQVRCCCRARIELASPPAVFGRVPEHDSGGYGASKGANPESWVLHFRRRASNRSPPSLSRLTRSDGGRNVHSNETLSSFVASFKSGMVLPRLSGRTRQWGEHNGGSRTAVNVNILLCLSLEFINIHPQHVDCGQYGDSKLVDSRMRGA